MFIRRHLGYRDIIYDKPHNYSFKNKIENVQYKACIAITDTIQETSIEHLYYELVLESLGDRDSAAKRGRWITKENGGA